MHERPLSIGHGSDDATALVEYLPNAALVVDHFHAIQLANTAIDDVRRRLQQEQIGHRGHEGDPLYRGRRVFLTGWDRLSNERISWLFDLLAAGDARRCLVVFFQHCADAEVPELSRLARTIDRWADLIGACHHPGRASNGRVENIHMLAEKTRRNARDVRSHHNDRRPLIGRLGIQWAAIPTRRIRGRQPRSNACGPFHCTHSVPPWCMGRRMSSTRTQVYLTDEQRERINRVVAAVVFPWRQPS
ncbi:MAG: transposase [Ilumatobacter sp.]|uniref:ISL3 family transposase n=1 Tax=Ilumatobacter sp. TaxID=1967498 RepID=UPI003918C4DD